MEQKQHTLVLLVEDHPGVLNRIVSLMRRRSFNIDSITVGHSEQAGISRMTIQLSGSDEEVEQVSDRVAIVRRGKLITEGSVDELLKRGGYIEVTVAAEQQEAARDVLRVLHDVEQVTIENAAGYARTGADMISSGSLTNSAPVLDIGLDIRPAN